MTYETLRLEHEAASGVATVTLDRPPRNALDLQMSRDLETAMMALRDDDAVGAVILTGAGKAFSGGGDLKGMGVDFDDTPAVRDFMASCHRAVLAMAGMEKPVVAAVNGDAAGAGWSLALAADLIVASTDARFIMAFVRVGAVPDLGAAWFLPRLVGPHKAREWMMLGEVVSAEEAHRLGVVNRLAEPPGVLPAAQEIASRLAAGPRRALGLMKQMVNRYGACALDAALEHEAYTQALAFKTEDFAEGRQAFFEKRTPKFKGK
jgi:2-(1,2-epoxy-1,2-dihydrophenyl)acetyl-CoA isomerase